MCLLVRLHQLRRYFKPTKGANGSLRGQVGGKVLGKAGFAGYFLAAVRTGVLCVFLHVRHQLTESDKLPAHLTLSFAHYIIDWLADMSLAHLKQELREAALNLQRAESETVRRMEVWEVADLDQVFRKLGVASPKHQGEVVLEAARLDLPNVLAYCIRGGLVESRNKLGESALHCAAKFGRSRMLGLLLAQGLVATESNRIGEIPLMFASESGSTEAVHLLIPCSNLLAVNAFGQSALHYAARAECELACEALLKAYKAMVNVKDQSGMTALDYAAEQGNTELMGVLEKYGAKLGNQTN